MVTLYMFLNGSSYSFISNSLLFIPTSQGRQPVQYITKSIPSFVYHLAAQGHSSYALPSLPMLTLGTTLAFLELATEEAALPSGLSGFSPASALMRSAIWRHSAQSIVHTAFLGLNEPTRGAGPPVALGSSPHHPLSVLFQYLL